jgi:hypothetical protein
VVTRSWLSGYAGENSAAGRAAWAARFYVPQVMQVYMDYESSWSQRAADVTNNRDNYLPSARDGLAINSLTIGLILCCPGGSTAMNPRALAAAGAGTDPEFVPGFTRVARAIRAAGLDAPSTVIRLGHEMDGYWYPWATNDRPALAASYILAYRRAHDVLKSFCPAIRFSLGYCTGGPTSDLALHYPGDDYVDIISSDFYDSEAKTEAGVVNEQAGRGIAQFGAFAQSHGKRYALDEWGLNGNDGDTRSRDNPAYVQGVFDELAALEARWPGIVSHDSYFNEGPHFYLTSSVNPRSVATYRAAWAVITAPPGATALPKASRGNGRTGSAGAS